MFFLYIYRGPCRFTFYLRMKWGKEGRKVEDIGVMKDEELKIEEMKPSHTLGGVR
jgi:hypothetical protein